MGRQRNRNDLKEEIMQSDIELAITGLGVGQQKSVVDTIPRSFTTEDRSSTGYGLVVRSISSEVDEEINKKLELVLGPLIAIAGSVADKDCIVRIAIFSSTATTTTTLTQRSFEILRMFNAKLEISVYPVDEEP